MFERKKKRKSILQTITKTKTRVFKNSKQIKKDQNTVHIDVTQRDKYNIVEKVADYHKLLVYAEMKNSDIIFFNNLQHVFKTNKVFGSNSKQEHLNSIRRQVKINTILS